MAAALGAVSTCGAEQTDQYCIEENTAENKTAYPYIVRTETREVENGFDMAEGNG